MTSGIVRRLDTTSEAPTHPNGKERIFSDLAVDHHLSPPGDCGDGCLELREVILEGDRVRWFGFKNAMAAGLDWDYADFGPFVFDRAAYELAIRDAMDAVLG